MVLAVSSTVKIGSFSYAFIVKPEPSCWIRHPVLHPYAEHRLALMGLE